MGRIDAPAIAKRFPSAAVALLFAVDIESAEGNPVGAAFKQSSDVHYTRPT